MVGVVAETVGLAHGRRRQQQASGLDGRGRDDHRLGAYGFAAAIIVDEVGTNDLATVVGRDAFGDDTCDQREIARLESATEDCVLRAVLGVGRTWEADTRSALDALATTVAGDRIDRERWREGFEAE